MNLFELSKTRNVPYSTVRKYVKALIAHGYINPERSSRSVILRVNDVEVFDRLLSLIRSGYPLQTALKMLGEGIKDAKSDIIFYLQRLERRIEELEKENHALRDIVQKYLAEIEKLKGLPPPKKSWREKIKEWFKRRRKNQE